MLNNTIRMTFIRCFFDLSRDPVIDEYSNPCEYFHVVDFYRWHIYPKGMHSELFIIRALKLKLKLLEIRILCIVTVGAQELLI